MDTAPAGLADLVLLLKGIAIGIAIAAPVGPVAILCIRRTIFYGRRYGIATGLGAVTADTIFGAIASFGLVAISEPLFDHQTALRFVGAFFLLGLGIATWRRRAETSEDAAAGRLARAYLSALFLTIANPITILAFTGIFAGFDVVRGNMGYLQGLDLMAGVMIGALLWWIGLTLFASLFRRRGRSEEELPLLHHISGGLLIVFGLAALGSIFVL
jgi:threonine/homoserine/homoserine lactone efflux protein